MPILHMYLILGRGYSLNIRSLINKLCIESIKKQRIARQIIFISLLVVLGIVMALASFIARTVFALHPQPTNQLLLLLVFLL